MPRFYFNIVERAIVIEDPEGSIQRDANAAIANAIRQIRLMVSQEIAETGQVDLRRELEIVSRDLPVSLIPFSQAISVSV